MLWARQNTAKTRQFHQARVRPSGTLAFGQRSASEDDEIYCRRRIAEEEAFAQSSGSPEAGLVHEQTAMLYRAQLATLMRLRN